MEYHCPCLTVVELPLKLEHVLRLKSLVMPPLRVVILLLLKLNVVLLVKLFGCDVAISAMILPLRLIDYCEP